MIGESSLFRKIRDAGLPSTFANAFTAEYFAAVATGRWRHSATTIAALAGGTALRFLPDLLVGNAVYQDLTRESLRERGYDVPLSTPEEAGRHLAYIGQKYVFTLFEYFQTDVAGHSADMTLSIRRLRQVDRFLDSLLAAVDLGSNLVMVVSDHGNIEDLGTRSHTGNDVPVLVFGHDWQAICAGLSRLDQVSARILSYLTGSPMSTVPSPGF